ncbi:MAG: hypothetical protein VYC39_18800 [Myxococcota bacterium]|nr:hypothetical protein [Myxococcota bacterium]
MRFGRSIVPTALALLCGGAVSCADLIPDEYRIEDLRILNIKVEPPEVPIFIAAENGELELALDQLPPPDLRPVTVTVVAAHPDLNATFQYDWIQCLPGLGPVPCDGNDRKRLSNNPKSTLEFTPVQILLDELIAQQQVSELAGGFTNDPRELLGGLLANVNVEIRVQDAAVSVDTPILEGQKRLILFEPRLVAQTILTARETDTSQIPNLEGISLPSLCTTASDTQIAEIFDFLRVRQPNENPRIEMIELGRLLRTDSSTLSATSSTAIVLSPGERISLTPVINEDAAESYQVIDGNCNLMDFTEKPVFSWFTNLGQLNSQISRLKDPKNIYQAPAASELESAETTVRIFTVVRDGRGGSDHQSFDIVIRK